MVRIYCEAHLSYPQLRIAGNQIEYVADKNIILPLKLIYHKDNILLIEGKHIFDIAGKNYFILEYKKSSENQLLYVVNNYVLTPGKTNIELFGIKLRASILKLLKGDANTKLFKSLKIENKPVKVATTASGLKDQKRVIAFQDNIIKLSLAKDLDEYIIIGQKLFKNPVVRVKPRSRIFAIVNDTAVFFDSKMVAEEYKVIEQTEKYIYLKSGIYNLDGMPIVVWELDPKGVKVEFEDGIIAYVSSLTVLEKSLGIVKINNIPVDNPKDITFVRAVNFIDIPSEDRHIAVTKYGVVVFHKNNPEYLIKDGRRFKAMNNPPLENAIYVIQKGEEMVAFKEIKANFVKREHLKLPRTVLKRVPFWLAEIKI